MSKDIESREKAIFLLQKADETIQKNYIDCETLPPELFNNISKTVTDLRIYSINVVTHMNRVREICSYSAISGKYNFDKLNETYLFESNYLIKMKSDLDFLSQTSLNLFFNFAESGDPFLVTISNIIPVSEDISKAIRQSHYTIAQDIIFLQLNENNQPINTNNTSNNNSSYAISNRDVTPASAKNFVNGGNKIQLEAKSKNYKKEDDRDDIIKKLGEYDEITKNLENDREVLKAKGKKTQVGKDYVTRILPKEDESNGGKWNEESDSDLDIERERKELERIKKFEEERRKEIERQKELERMKELEKAKQLKKKKEQEEKEKELKLKMDLESKKELEELKEKERKSKEAEDKRIEEEKKRLHDEELRKLEEEKKRKEEEERKIKEEEELKKKEEEERKKKEEEEERKRKEEEERKRKEEEDRKRKEEEDRKRKEEEELKKRKEEEERKRKEEEEEIKRKEEAQAKEVSDRPMPLLKDKIKITKESDVSNNIPPSPYNNKFSSPRSSLNKSLLRSLTPESHSKRTRDKYHISFYNGNLKEFQIAYSTYYKSLSDNQKVIFNIKEDPAQSITPYYNPKIIFCTSLKNKFILKGLCIFYFDCSNQSNIKVIISHLSSSDKDSMVQENILGCLIEYIKEYVECNEIYIDLYYKFNETEGKFSIDTEIKDYFKKTLLFKWAKLENLANHIRYQKMYLKLKQEDTSSNLKLEGEDEVNIMLNQSNILAINNKKIIPYPLLTINTTGILSLNDKPSDNIINYDKYMNIFLSTYLLNKLKTEDYKLTSSEENNKQMVNWSVEENENIVKLLSYKSSNKVKDINEHLHQNLNENEYESYNYINSMMMNLTLLIQSSIASPLNGYIYNRIEKDIKVLSDKKTSHKFYLIPTTDGNNSLIISTLSNDIKSKLLESNDNLYSIFNTSFYSNLEQKENDKSDITLWIPCFDIDTHLQSDTMNFYEGIEIKKDDKKCYIGNIDEFINMKYGYEREKDSMFSINVKDDDIIFDKDFIFGIVNVDVLTHFNMSTILLLHVTKDHFIKCDS